MGSDRLEDRCATVKPTTDKSCHVAWITYDALPTLARENVNMGFFGLCVAPIRDKNTEIAHLLLSFAHVGYKEASVLDRDCCGTFNNNVRVVRFKKEGDLTSKSMY